MGPGETAGIVIVTVATVQAVFKLVEHLLTKYVDKKEKDEVVMALLEIESKIGNECGLNEIQSQQLKQLHDTLTRVDSDGVPLAYLPRSWMDMQKEIVDKMHVIVQTEYKMLGIIERLERSLEARDKRD